MSDKMNFEQAMTRLEEIVKLLERGEVSIEDSLKLFEEGAALMKKCNKILDQAEQKVSLIMRGNEGEPVPVPFEDEV